MIKEIIIGMIVVIAIAEYSCCIVEAPDFTLPESWDCSNNAAYIFITEKRLGHEPIIVYGQNFTSMEGHAWTENENGKVLIGGLDMKREDLYNRFPVIEYYSKIPTGSIEWEKEWSVINF